MTTNLGARSRIRKETPNRHAFLEAFIDVRAERTNSKREHKTKKREAEGSQAQHRGNKKKGAPQPCSKQRVTCDVGMALGGRSKESSSHPVMSGGEPITGASAQWRKDGHGGAMWKQQCKQHHKERKARKRQTQCKYVLLVRVVTAQTRKQEPAQERFDTTNRKHVIIVHMCIRRYHANYEGIGTVRQDKEKHWD